MEINKRLSPPKTHPRHNMHLCTYFFFDVPQLDKNVIYSKSSCPDSRRNAAVVNCPLNYFHMFLYEVTVFVSLTKARIDKLFETLAAFCHVTCTVLDMFQTQHVSNRTVWTLYQIYNINTFFLCPSSSPFSHKHMENYIKYLFVVRERLRIAW